MPPHQYKLTAISPIHQSTSISPSSSSPSSSPSSSQSQSQSQSQYRPYHYGRQRTLEGPRSLNAGVAVINHVVMELGGIRTPQLSSGSTGTLKITTKGAVPNARYSWTTDEVVQLGFPNEMHEWIPLWDIGTTDEMLQMGVTHVERFVRQEGYNGEFKRINDQQLKDYDEMVVKDNIQGTNRYSFCLTIRKGKATYYNFGAERRIEFQSKGRENWSWARKIETTYKLKSKDPRELIVISFFQARDYAPGYLKPNFYKGVSNCGAEGPKFVFIFAPKTDNATFWRSKIRILEQLSDPTQALYLANVETIREEYERARRRVYEAAGLKHVPLIHQPKQGQPSRSLPKAIGYRPSPLRPMAPPANPNTFPFIKAGNAEPAVAKTMVPNYRPGYIPPHLRAKIITPVISQSAPAQTQSIPSVSPINTAPPVTPQSDFMLIAESDTSTMWKRAN
ncbi:hypothetical protein H072_8895 [Dactylellina haptotyla CBS 200.50]|uniref:Uncharacterized protein n=1 Tax=Dactylellina haptotyla (strain CBS 200.50) TaxID=1284197 RepID=S8A374_DACHA|nr:hypothetical protein H072_8895 [Dactylellina haptotyla CBS 200.50]